jgi:VanZ family protein
VNLVGPKTTFGLAIVCLGLAVAGLLVPLPNQSRSPWVSKLLDVGHVPLFALVTVCFWRLVGRRIWLAFSLAVVSAVAAEVGQTFVDRSGDLLDVVRGLLGALIAVVWLQLRPRAVAWRRIAAGSAITCALAAWPFWDCGPILLDAVRAYRSFPVLSDFQSPWEPLRWFTDGALLKRVAAVEHGEGWAGRLDVSPHQGGNGAILFPIVQDWSSYRRLGCTFSFSGEPLRILISVRDGRKARPPLRRFDLERVYVAGRHRVVIDLHDLAAGQRFAPLDLTRIQSFHIVATQLTESRTLYLHTIELE